MQVACRALCHCRGEIFRLRECRPAFLPFGTSRAPGRHRFVARAIGQVERGGQHNGVYGPWSIEKEDVLEVYGYRAGLTASAAAFGIGTILTLASPDDASSVLNPLCMLGSAGLGASLLLIHIYVTPLKRTLQILWGLGTAGGVYLMMTQEGPLPLYVVHHPWAVWLVGPLFAALTGVAFKEGVCYGKAEAGLLFGCMPLLLLGHLSGLLPEGVQEVMTGVTALVFAVFAGRKFTQQVKDDIGDKSVFEFQKMSAAEQQEHLRRLQEVGYTRD